MKTEQGNSFSRRLSMAALAFLFLAGSSRLPGATLAYKDKQRAEQVRREHQPIADQGNGWYRNPVLAGDYGGPSVVKVGKDYYLAFSRNNGFMLWHSRDLVNWRPLARRTYGDRLKDIRAVDLQYFSGKFHLYLPVGSFPDKTEKYHVNFVTTAENPMGPWTEPTRVDRTPIEDSYYTGIDPGFVQTPEGDNFLYTDHGFVMPLTRDGLQAKDIPIVVYGGWRYPRDWIVQCKCLESPKLFRKDGYYYLVSAQGGSSGPSTAHMAIVARSTSPIGPWSNSPCNPLIRTYSASEKWWQQGHATIIEGPDGSWWTIFQARLNGAPGIGRQTLLMPIEWTPDGWPVIKSQLRSSDLIPMPRGENVGHGMPISDSFKVKRLGIQWVYNRGARKRIIPGDGQLIVQAKGEQPKQGTMLSVGANTPNFEATVEVDCPAGVTAGLCFGNWEGLKTDGQSVSYLQGDLRRTRNTDVTLRHPGHVWLKIRNLHDDLSFHASEDGVNWHTFQNGVRSSNYTIRLFASGEGEAVFRDFKYLGLD